MTSAQDKYIQSAEYGVNQAQRTFENFKDYSAASVKNESGQYDHIIFADRSAKNQPLQFRKGQWVKVVSTTASLKVDTVVQLKDAYKQGPYVNYLGGGVCLKHGEIVKASRSEINQAKK